MEREEGDLERRRRKVEEREKVLQQRLERLDLDERLTDREKETERQEKLMAILENSPRVSQRRQRAGMTILVGIFAVLLGLLAFAWLYREVTGHTMFGG